MQIPYDLFLALLQYHLMMDDDYEDEIRYGLERKLEAMVRHELYAKYKTALTPKEREAARQRYLAERGIPRATDGLLPLGSYDRSVTRSCEWQTRQSID